MTAQNARLERAAGRAAKREDWRVGSGDGARVSGPLVVTGLEVGAGVGRLRRADLSGDVRRDRGQRIEPTKSAGVPITAKLVDSSGPVPDATRSRVPNPRRRLYALGEPE